MTLSPASSVEGGAGLLALLFSSVLAAGAASIDTGAGGIDGGYDVLEIFLLARTTEAATFSNLTFTVNDDTSSVYDRQFIRGSAGTASANTSLGTAGWVIPTAGASDLAGTFGSFRFTFPHYAATVANKTCVVETGVADSTGLNCRAETVALGYRSTAAISRFKVAAPGGANLDVGTTLLIYGR